MNNMVKHTEPFLSCASWYGTTAICGCGWTGKNWNSTAGAQYEWACHVKGDTHDD